MKFLKDYTFEKQEITDKIEKKNSENKRQFVSVLESLKTNGERDICVTVQFKEPFSDDSPVDVACFFIDSGYRDENLKNNEWLDTQFVILCCCLMKAAICGNLGRYHDENCVIHALASGSVTVRFDACVRYARLW